MAVDAGHDDLVDQRQLGSPPILRIRQVIEEYELGLTPGCFNRDCFRLCLGDKGFSSCTLGMNE